jgi:DNA segregation ATPase FtsK/SpoIIIE, S-DNA-T family
MKYVAAALVPTRNKRLNELIGLVLFAGALLLGLALVSYSPKDPSWNTAASPLASPHNWIGVVGAGIADAAFQICGVAVFLLPVLITALALRWFCSRQVDSPLAKFVGSASLLVFLPALMALLPWHWRWLRAIPMEGLLGRIVGDALIHYLNLTGAYIICATLIAVALYLSTAFSFGAVRLWAATRFGFVYAWIDRFQDWRTARAKARAQKELEKRRQARPVVPTQIIPARRAQMQGQAPAAQRTGIERASEIEMETATEPARDVAPAFAAEETMPHEDIAPIAAAPEVTQRADADQRGKTTLSRMASGFKMPSTALLARPEEHGSVDEAELQELAGVLTSKCAEFDVRGQVTQINPGPVVTTFEFKPEAGIKYSRITGLTDDLCLGMKAESILIERMPGKSTVGIQVPNHKRETIRLREVIESAEFNDPKSRLTLALGKDINGRMACADLASMPHLLIAGSTGAGKSVALNAMIMSFLYKATPEQVRMILVDPKRLELGVYEGAPHLFVPIITEPKLASNALRNAVREMERRLKLLAEKGVRNIDQYNKLFEEESTPSLFSEDEEKPLPYIVIIIDELADLMMLDGKNVEESITRLAQMARAVGIHLVLATQRPSVDVITGLIKANFPARISFRVATKIDSRTILDGNGAESLLGKGDMLYLPSGSSRLVRLHAPFVTEKEIAAVVEFWRSQGPAQYEQGFLDAPCEEGSRAAVAGEDVDLSENQDDELYQDAVKLVLEFGKASTSLLQRRLRIGYGRAAHLIDLMEQDGIVGSPDGPKPREVLKKPDWLSAVEDYQR